MRLFAVAALLLAAPAAAQSPFPGGVNVNGGWVPCNHPIAIAAGQGCTGSAPTPAPDPAPPAPRDCRTVDPYAEPLLAWVCALEDAYRRGDRLQTLFMDRNLAWALPVVGREYVHAYYPALDRLRVVSLGFAKGDTQRLVVTIEFIAGQHTGQFASFTNGDNSPGHEPWKMIWKESIHP